MTYKDLALIIKQKRKKLNITQKEMADSLFISLTRYNKFENGNREPNFEMIVQIIKILDISLDDVIKKEKPKSLYFD